MPTDLLVPVDAVERELRQLLQDPVAQSGALLAARPADVAEALDRFPEGAEAVAESLPVDRVARILHECAGEVQRRLLEVMGVERAATVLDALPMDEAARVLEALRARRREALLAAMAPVNRDEVSALLAYPARSAGRLMTERFPTVDLTNTAAEALAHLRREHAASETLTDLYTVDADRRLTGVVSLREVVVADPGTPLRDLLTTDVVSVAPRRLAGGSGTSRVALRLLGAAGRRRQRSDARGHHRRRRHRRLGPRVCQGFAEARQRGRRGEC